MPAATITAVIGAAVGLATGASLATVAIGFVGSLVLGAVSQALTKKPKGAEAGHIAFEARDRTITVRQPTAPWRIIYGQARVGGTYAFIGSSTDPAGRTNGYLHLVIVLAGHECEEIGSIYFDDYALSLEATGSGYQVTSSDKYHTANGSTVYIEKFLGTDTQAAASYLSQIGIGWTSQHRLLGRTYLYVRLLWDPDIYPNGIPNISAIVKGRKVYDPRTEQTAWSANPVLCLADYLTNDEFGLAADYATEIDEDTVIAEANVCDEDVALAAGGVESRYACNGSFTTDATPKSIIEELLTSMAGKVVYVGGKWRIHAGSYRAPTVTLDERHIRSNIRIRSRVSRRENFNAVKGLFVSPQNAWQPTDFPAVISDVYAEEDNGERVFKDISLPYTTSVAMAQRLAKIELLRARQQITATMPCTLAAYQLQVPDTVQIDNTRMGWSAKAFEVANSTLVMDKDDEDVPYLACDIVLRETDPSVYDWTTDEEQEYDPAPDTTLPNPFGVGAPSNVSADSGSEHLLELSEGSIISRIYFAWDAVPNAFVREYEAEFKKSSEDNWTPAPAPKSATSVYVMPVEDGTSYDLRVRAVNELGVRGEYTTLTGHIVIGKTEPPPPPDSFTVERGADGTRRYNWTLDNEPSDVRSGGGYRIRYFLGATADWDAMTPLHGGLLKSSPYESNELAAGSYTFAIKTVDSSGNESTAAVFVSVTLGDPRLRNVLLGRSEHTLGWPGTKTDCYVDTDGALRLALSTGSPQGDWASLSGTAWSDLSGTTWAKITERNASLVYTTPVIDLGANVSFTPLLSFVGGGSITTMIATGEDGQSPTVDAFQPMTGAVLAKRYVQFEITATDDISQLTILLDGDTQTDEFDDVDTSAETAVWFESIAPGHFRIGTKSENMAVITMARINAIQNAGGRATWELISKSETVGGSPGVVAAEFKTYDAAGTLTDYTVDVELRGPKIQ